MQNALNHLAIIMDGNGRWANRRGMPRIHGHRRGVNVVRPIAEACRKLGISTLTLYSFSSENWTRPATEVGELMTLLSRFLTNELDQFHAEGVRLRIIGDLEKFDPKLRSQIEDAVVRTQNNREQTVVLALSYGGRQELVSAVQAIAEQVQSGALDPSLISEQLIGANLHAPDIPDPDLVVRTSGEQRLSNFLLWQVAYSEFAFTQTLWPDFSPDELRQIVSDFQKRDRRFGGSKEKLSLANPLKIAANVSTVA